MTDRYQLALEILDNYYPSLKTDVLLKSLVFLFSQKLPVFVKAGRYDMISHPPSGYAYSADFAHVMDYFIDTHLNSEIEIEFDCQPMEAFDYQLAQQKLRLHGAIEYPLNSLVWQILHYILSKDLQAINYQWLRLKCQFMPQFNSIGQVPAYIPNVIASCMTEAKSLNELKYLFPEIDDSALQRLFLLCVLTGVADLRVLHISHKSNQRAVQSVDGHFSTSSQPHKRKHNNKTTSNHSTHEQEKKQKHGIFQRLFLIERIKEQE